MGQRYNVTNSHGMSLVGFFVKNCSYFGALGVGNHPHGIAISPEGVSHVANFGDNTVSVINATWELFPIPR
jgi:DNA-binding beta-propeller fold protein YncE